MKWKLGISILLVLFGSSCKKHQLDDCFSAAGKDGEETRSVESYDKIVVGDKIKLTLIQDSANEGKVIIKAGKNLIEGVLTEVDNGVLTVDNQNICNFVRSYKHKIEVEVYFKTLSRLEVNTAANVETRDTIRTPFLHILNISMGDTRLMLESDEVFVQSLNGAGTFLNGKIGTVKASIEGISFLDARDLNCLNIFLDTHSPLDCFVNGEEIIFAKIYNSGNIFYRSEPTVLKEVNEKTGEGELLRLQ